MEPLWHPAADRFGLVTVMAALADATRLDVLRQLASVEERSCGDVDTPLATSTMTRHYRILREAGLIRVRVDGKHRMLALRRHDIQDRFPGLLELVLAEHT